MVKFSSFSVLAAVLCAALFFSCSSDPEDYIPSSSSVRSSSSSLKPSSSSDKPSSSSDKPSSSSVRSSSSNTVDSDPDLYKKTITLSYSGSSYADIDGNISIHRQGEVLNGKLDKIDLIAHCGTTNWCESNLIYSPHAIGLFWTDNNVFLGSSKIWFINIPSAQAEVFKRATKRSEIIDAYNSLVEGVLDDEDNYLEKVSIVVGQAFFVVTSEGKYSVVIIEATGNQSVDLQIIQLQLPL